MVSPSKIDLFHLAGIDQVRKRRVIQRLGLPATGAETLEYGQQHNRDDDPQNDVFCEVVQWILARLRP